MGAGLKTQLLSINVIRRLVNAEPLTVKHHLVLVVTGFVALALLEVLFHWVICQSRILCGVYLLRTPNSGMAIFPDLLIPAAALGWWNGWVSRGESSKRAVVCVTPLALGIAVLLRVYCSLVPQKTIWWQSNPWEAALSFATAFFTALIVIYFFSTMYHKDMRI